MRTNPSLREKGSGIRVNGTCSNGKLFRGHIECIDSTDDDGGLMYTVVYEDGDGDKRQEGSRSSGM